jgi:hypothetical protein
MQFVQDVPIDVDKIAAVGPLPDQMKVPDLIEQSTRHGVIHLAWIDRKAANISGYLGRLDGSMQASSNRPCPLGAKQNPASAIAAMLARDAY